MAETPKVIMYGTRTCPYCLAARMLLKKLRVEFEDVLSSKEPDRFAEGMRLSGNRTVPQIFIGDAPIGGYDNLSALHSSGELAQMLASDTEISD